MQITATIIADSIAANGVRLTTLECYYHRYILAELNTHRDFTRNGASSRAIPTAKLLQTVITEQVEPLEWGLNIPGMQAGELASPALRMKGKQVWDKARWAAVNAAQELTELGFAKQIVNRLLEPFLPTKTVLSSTNWANFDALRDHKDAQPEIRELARQVIAAREASTPRVLGAGDWHLPYILPEDYEEVKRTQTAEIVAEVANLMIAPSAWFKKTEIMVLAMVSAARCARASYRLSDGRPTSLEDDLKLFVKLVKDQPVHASPTEHQATPLCQAKKTATSGNFRGFAQFRKGIRNETVWDTHA